MDQIKIGQFIAECRKAKNLTQAQLAEKLYITDRAVSKWERGKGLPDASIMLDLCNELGIIVNELLRGEKIEMENYDKKTEELLIEMVKNEGRKNKNLMVAMWTITVVSIVSMVAALLTVGFLIEEGLLQTIIAIGTTVLFLITCYIGLKLEVEAGYYECKNCHHLFVPTYKETIMGGHLATTRRLTCPECHKRTWCKKVLKK